MYTTCTIRLAEAREAPFLLGISRPFVWVALAAWAITFAGMLRSWFVADSTPERR